MRMRIYGLSGRKQSGKDTFATIAENQLQNHHSNRVALAGPLKQFCMDYVGLPHEACYGLDEDKNAPFSTWGQVFGQRLCDRYSKAPHESISGREIMQVVGTDVFRECFRGTFWVDIMKRSLERYASDGVNVVFITDVRFANEIEAIKEIGGKLIRIVRDVGQKDQIIHKSETEMMNIPDDEFDYVVDNSGTLKALEEYVSAILQEEDLHL